MELEFGLWENLQLHFVHELANLILNCKLLSRVLSLQLLFTGSDLLEMALISSISLLCFRNAVGLNKGQNNLSRRNSDLSASSSLDSFLVAPNDRKQHLSSSKMGCDVNQECSCAPLPAPAKTWWQMCA